MIKVSRFLKDSSSDTVFPYWECVRYFEDVDVAYEYYNYYSLFGTGNCALTISDGIVEHTVLEHYTDDFPECMKKRVVMIDLDTIMDVERNKE